MNWWWYAARAAGLVAWVLAIASVLWGLLLSSRVLQARLPGRRPVAPWLLDLHSYLGALTAVFTLGHLAALLGDSYIQFDLVDLLVPMAAPWHPVAIAWGVAGLWGLVAVLGTSWSRRWIPVTLWRRMHWVSFPIAVVTTAHTFTAGSDRTHPLTIGIGVVLGAVAVSLCVYRVLGPRGKVARGGAPVPAPQPFG
jgi:hypothetical protein